MNRIFFLLGLLALGISNAAAQQIGEVNSDGTRTNSLIVAVPFLRITPGARISGMGNAGVATRADDNSSAINAASMAYLPSGSTGIGITYTPWMKNLVPDMALSYLSGYRKIDERSTIGASLRYFSLGTINVTDDDAQELGTARPSEFAADVTYARSFGEEFALGGSVRFIKSNLFSGQTSSGGQAGKGSALAVDISGIYRTGIMLLGGPADWSLGVNVSNIGTKMSYDNSQNQYFLPTELKIGSALTFIGNESKLTFALDVNKLLIPTQPIYSENGEILKGKDPERSVPAGIFGSFNDAPGGFKEEVKEMCLSTGLELLFRDRAIFRAGYNYQDAEKGNGSYFTVGTGFRYQIYRIDISYLTSSQRNNPLANTLRFGLALNLLSKSGN